MPGKNVQASKGFELVTHDFFWQKLFRQAIFRQAIFRQALSRHCLHRGTSSVSITSTTYFSATDLMLWLNSSAPGGDENISNLPYRDNTLYFSSRN